MSCDSWRLALPRVYVCVFKQFHMVQSGLNNDSETTRDPYTFFMVIKEKTLNYFHQFLLVSLNSIDRETFHVRAVQIGR